MRFLPFLLLLMVAPACADEAQDFMAAREAFATGNAGVLETLATRMRGSPLEPYITYYRLRMRWDEEDDTLIRDFLARPDDTPVIDQFRREWLKHMAQLGRWEAFEAGKITRAKILNTYLSDTARWPPAELDMAWRNPQLYLQNTAAASQGRRGVALFALQRLAHRSVDLAYTAWQRIVGYFPEAERQQGFAALGYAAALAHDERALGWFEAAGDAKLSENQRAWRVRAALRAENWHEVRLGIAAMPPEQQNLSAWRYWKARALKALGHTAEADVVFAELSRAGDYYGQLALEELGEAPGAWAFTERFAPDEAEVAAMQARPGIRRTLLLYRKGMIHQLDLNLRLGTYYMKTLYSRFGDNPVLASVAYNAGPTRAKKWLANRPLEGAIYIETIPFYETRDYVRKVMSNTIYYARLFGHSNETLKQRLGVIEGKAPMVSADER